MDLTLVTFRDIFQYEAKKKGIRSEDYRKLSAVVFMDKGDMNKISVKSGQMVKLSNEVGSVVLTANQSEDEPHPGLAFMLDSPWANSLIRDDVCQTSTPEFKGVTVSVEPAAGDVTQVSELLLSMRACWDRELL